VDENAYEIPHIPDGTVFPLDPVEFIEAFKGYQFNIRLNGGSYVVQVMGATDRGKMELRVIGRYS
jgi:hypothetical protein